jgi:hypothetical protein
MLSPMTATDPSTPNPPTLEYSGPVVEPPASPDQRRARKWVIATLLFVGGFHSIALMFGQVSRPDSAAKLALAGAPMILCGAVVLLASKTVGRWIAITGATCWLTAQLLQFFDVRRSWVTPADDLEGLAFAVAGVLVLVLMFGPLASVVWKNEDLWDGPHFDARQLARGLAILTVGLMITLPMPQQWDDAMTILRTNGGWPGNLGARAMVVDAALGGLMTIVWMLWIVRVRHASVVLLVLMLIASAGSPFFVIKNYAWADLQGQGVLILRGYFTNNFFWFAIDPARVATCVLLTPTFERLLRRT